MTPEESGRELLSIFGSTKPASAGCMRLYTHLHGPFVTEQPGKGEHFKPGIRWLQENGFIEVKPGPWPGGVGYFLTEKGEKEFTSLPNQETHL